MNLGEQLQKITHRANDIINLAYCTFQVLGVTCARPFIHETLDETWKNSLVVDDGIHVNMFKSRVVFGEDDWSQRKGQQRHKNITCHFRLLNRGRKL